MKKKTTKHMEKNTPKQTRKINRQKAALAKKAMEADARRKVAKNWDIISKGVRYVKAAAKKYGHQTTLKLKKELFDGIFLNLNDRNSKKSYNVQQRLLRRIVEKRQAQTIRRRTGHTNDLFAKRVSKTSYCKCINYFKSYQRGA